MNLRMSPALAFKVTGPPPRTFLNVERSLTGKRWVERLTIEGMANALAMALTREIQNSWIASRCGWTPFDGMKTKGWAVAAVLRGAFVMREFAAVGAARGAPVRFVETLEPSGA